MADYYAADGVSKAVIRMERNAGDALVRAGILVAVPYSKPKRDPQLTFGVAAFRDGRPFIVANCATCKQKGINGPQFRFEGPDPAGMLCSHCGVNERCPQDVAEEYVLQLMRFLPQEKEIRPRQTPVQVHEF
jgi:hypothetical protein